MIGYQSLEVLIIMRDHSKILLKRLPTKPEILHCLCAIPEHMPVESSIKYLNVQ